MNLLWRGFFLVNEIRKLILPRRTLYKAINDTYTYTLLSFFLFFEASVDVWKCWSYIDFSFREKLVRFPFSLFLIDALCKSGSVLTRTTELIIFAYIRRCEERGVSCFLHRATGEIFSFSHLIRLWITLFEVTRIMRQNWIFRWTNFQTRKKKDSYSVRDILNSPFFLLRR